MSVPPAKLAELRIQRDETSRPRARRTPLMLGILVLAVIAAGSFWLMRSPAVVVRTAVAVAVSSGGADRTVLNASGYVTARREATVSSKVTGKVVQVLIEEGAKVTEGQELARLDDANTRASHALAHAQTDAARAALAETRVRLKEAEQELQRQTDLRRGNASPQAEFDRAENALLALRARLEQQQADVAVAERTVAIWAQQLDDMTIRAPFAGIVTSKNAQPGEMISPMSSGGFTRTGICTIVDMESLEIEIDVNESYINRVSPGQSVEATLDAYPDWRIPCHVIAIIPTADRNKSTVRVRVGFDKLDPRILPDMSAKVAFRETEGRGPATSPGVRVPKSAIRTEGSRSLVWVLHNERLERRAVSVGGSEADYVVVNSGLTAGERVVLEPAPTLSETTKVKESAP